MYQKVTKREKQLAIQWRSGLLSLSDVARKIKKNQPSQAYSMLARALRAIHHEE
jgi:hypothetical protein